MPTTGKLVVFMMMPLLYKGYSLFVDHYYTSVELFHYLHGNGRMWNCSKIPSIVRNSVIKMGATVAYAKNDILCCKFRDKRDVFMMTTIWYA